MKRISTHMNPSGRRLFGQRLLFVLLTLAMMLTNQSSTVSVQAATNTLHLAVASAADSPTYGITKGDAISQFKYMINVDNTGTTEQRSPADGCQPDSPGYPELLSLGIGCQRRQLQPNLHPGRRDRLWRRH